MTNESSTRVLVLTSTFPRWNGDEQPPFVYELSYRYKSPVHVLCPHAKDAAQFEIMDGMQVHRFRYAPDSLENLTYEGGMLQQLKQKNSMSMSYPYVVQLDIKLLRKILSYLIGVGFLDYVLSIRLDNNV